MTTEVFRYADVDLRSAGLYMAVADGVNSAPPVRGKNLVIPYQHGERWAQKYYGERSIVLTGELGSLVSRMDMQTKLDTLKALFPIGSGEQKLEVQRADGTYRYAMAEVRNAMGLQWLVWPTRSVPYSIELVASDPFWYGSALEGLGWTFDSGVMVFDDGIHWFDQGVLSLTTSPVTVDAPNSGTIFNRKPIFYLAGAMTNPKIFNQRNNYWLQVNLTTVAADLLVIDCGAQTVTKNGLLQAMSVVGLGPAQTDWMHLEAGLNPLQVTLGPGPVAAVNYQGFYSPAYL